MQRERRRVEGRLVMASATSRAWRPVGHWGRSRAARGRSEPGAVDYQPSWTRRASPRPWSESPCRYKQSVSATRENAECGQRATERPCEMISRGSRHTGRGAAGEGGGRRLTCACRARAAPFAAVDGERRHRRGGQIGGGAAEGRRASRRKSASWAVPWRSYRGGRAALQGPGAAPPSPGRWAAVERAAADRCGRAER